MNDFKAHAESTDIVKIEGLLKAGFYISNTILVMELPLEGVTLFKTDVGEIIERYDPASLDEYIEANKKGFGVSADPSMIYEELSLPGGDIYVIRQRKKIVSSVTTWNYDKETIAVENIFTVSPYRNRHFASAILSYILINAQRMGMKRARLTVYGDNTEAIAMYQKYGFSVKKVLQEFMA